MSEKNAKNQILEWLQSLGWPQGSLNSERLTREPPHRVRATLTVTELDLSLTAEAEGQDKGSAGVAACELLLAELRLEHSGLFFEPDVLASDAQAGDALLKLAIYGWEAPLSPAQRNNILQNVESDRDLAGRLEELTAGLPWAQRFGPGIGRKMRSTIVEAALWRRFRDAFRAGDVRLVLPDVRRVMGVEAPPGVEDPHS